MSELLVYRVILIFRAFSFFGWKSFVEKKNSRDHMSLSERIFILINSPMLFFFYLAFLPKTALPLNGNYFSVLESYKISEPHHTEASKTPTGTGRTGVFTAQTG